MYFEIYFPREQYFHFPDDIFFPFCNSRYCCTLRFLSFALCKGQGISEYFETIYVGGVGDKQGKWPSGQLAGKARRRHPTDLAQSTTCLQGWEETWPIGMFFWKWGSHHWVAEPSCVQKNQQSEEKDEKSHLAVSEVSKLFWLLKQNVRLWPLRKPSDFAVVEIWVEKVAKIAGEE